MNVRRKFCLNLTLLTLPPGSGITPKADTLVADKAARDAKAETLEVQPSPPDASTGNALFTAAKNLNDHLTTLHAALPPRTALLFFSGHSDPRSMSTLAARRVEYQASQQVKQSGSSSAVDGSATVRWSTVDDRTLEETVVRARMGLLFVGVKT